MFILLKKCFAWSEQSGHGKKEQIFLIIPKSGILSSANFSSRTFSANA
jgi:hypothetical protein